MPNQWKSLFEGVIGGGQSFLEGLGRREQKNNASQLYDQTRQTYDKVNQLKSRAGEIIMNMGNLNPVTGFPQVEQKDNTADISKLYGDIQSNYGKLLQNPYGENYVNLLDRFYKPKKEEYSLFRGNSGDYKFDKTTGKYEMIGQKTEKPKQQEYEEVTIRQDDGRTYETFRVPKNQSTEDFSNKKDWISLGVTKDKPLKLGGHGGLNKPNPTNMELDFAQYVSKSKDFNKTYGKWNDTTGNKEQKVEQETLKNMKDALRTNYGFSESEMSVLLDKYQKGEKITSKELTNAQRESYKINDSFNDAWYNQKSVVKNGQKMSLNEWISTFYQAPDIDTLNSWLGEFKRTMASAKGKVSPEVYAEMERAYNSYASSLEGTNAENYGKDYETYNRVFK